jgi:hypothetical protein
VKNGNLLHPFGDTPPATGAGWEQGHIARPKPGFYAIQAADEDFALKEISNFVFLSVVPIENSGRAVPRHSMRRFVLRADQQFCTALGISADDPGRAER